MRRFVLNKTAAPYFLNIVWFIRDQCTTLDALVANSTFVKFLVLDSKVSLGIPIELNWKILLQN
jgi:hypothetical protein